MKIDKETGLRECPFCGGLPTSYVRIVEMCGGQGKIDFTIKCSSCGTDKTIRLTVGESCVFLDVEKAMSKAIAVWNQRAGDKDED